MLMGILIAANSLKPRDRMTFILDTDEPCFLLC